jgi:HSP20 family protein
MALTPFLGDPLFGGMDRLMERMLGRDLTTMPTFGSVTQAVSHPMDIIDAEKEFIIRCDAPGMDTKDVNVEVNEGVLTISGRKQMEAEDKDKEGKIVRRERHFTSFNRSFTLPENVDEDAISAALDKGVLTIKVAKTSPPEKPAPKRITVNAAS